MKQEIPAITSYTANDIKYDTMVSGAAIGVEQTTQSPGLESSIYHRVFFELDDDRELDEYTFMLTTIDPNGVETTKDVVPTYEEARDRYYVIISDIPAAYLDYMYTIQVVHNTTGEVYTVQTSVLCWAKLIIQKSTNMDQVNMAKAIYYYNLVANDVFKK